MTAVDEATSVRTPTNGQRLFLGYTLFILVDLTVLNFFDEYWYRVEIESFTISLLAAAFLQVLVIPFIVVVIAIIIAETILSKIYTMLADEPISH